jgi:hypothetical protein
MFIEHLARELAMPLKDVEVRKVASGLTTLANEKQKEQRDKASGKKKPKAAAKPAIGAAKASSKCVLSFFASYAVSNLFFRAGSTQAFTTRRWMISGVTISCRLLYAFFRYLLSVSPVLLYNGLGRIISSRFVLDFRII